MKKYFFMLIACASSLQAADLSDIQPGNVGNRPVKCRLFPERVVKEVRELNEQRMLLHQKLDQFQAVKGSLVTPNDYPWIDQIIRENQQKIKDLKAQILEKVRLAWVDGKQDQQLEITLPSSQALKNKIDNEKDDKPQSFSSSPYALPSKKHHHKKKKAKGFGKIMAKGTAEVLRHQKRHAKGKERERLKETLRETKKLYK